MLLMRDFGCSGETRKTYLGMLQLFQLVQRRQEHISRTFDHPQDVIVRRRGRTGGSNATALPEGLHLSEDDDRLVSVDRLRAEGADLAQPRNFIADAGGGNAVRV